MNTSHAAFNNAMPLTDPLALAKRRLFNPGFNLEFSGRSLAKHQDQVVQLCFDILDDPSLQDEDAPGGGCAPINAVRLLAAWKIDAAIPRLWRVIETPYCDDVLLDEILNALCEWGDAAVDALFPFTQTVAHNCRLLLGAILSSNGRRNSRVHDWVLTQLEVPQSDDEVHGFAGCLLEVDSMLAIPYLVTHILDNNQYSDDVRQRVCIHTRDYLLDCVVF